MDLTAFLSFFSVLCSSSLLRWFFCVFYPLSGVGNQTRFILRQILPCSRQWVRVISRGLWDTEEGRGLQGRVGGIWRRRWKEKWSWWGPQQRSSVIPAEGVSSSNRSTCKKKRRGFIVKIKHAISLFFVRCMTAYKSKSTCLQAYDVTQHCEMKNKYLGCSCAYS